MAQKTVVTLEDDLDGGTATETVDFSLDGKPYEIDLSSEHARQLRALAAPYVEKARKAPGSGRGAARPRNAPPNGADSRKVRDWAKSRGIEVNDRGRVPGNVVAQYQAAANT